MLETAISLPLKDIEVTFTSCFVCFFLNRWLWQFSFLFFVFDKRYSVKKGNALRTIIFLETL